MSSKSGSRRFQPGEGPSRGFFRDYDPSCGPLFLALVNTEQDTGLLSSPRTERESAALKHFINSEIPVGSLSLRPHSSEKIRFQLRKSFLFVVRRNFAKKEQFHNV